jgi:hypothetical protein
VRKKLIGGLLVAAIFAIAPFALSLVEISCREIHTNYMKKAVSMTHLS